MAPSARRLRRAGRHRSAAYLRAWGDDAREALALAVPLGWALRCVGVYDQSAELDPADQPGLLDGLEPRLRMLVRGFEPRA